MTTFNVSVSLMSTISYCKKTITERVKFKNQAKSKILTKIPTKTGKNLEILTPKQMLG